MQVRPLRGALEKKARLNQCELVESGFFVSLRGISCKSFVVWAIRRSRRSTDARETRPTCRSSTPVTLFGNGSSAVWKTSRIRYGARSPAQRPRLPDESQQRTVSSVWGAGGGSAEVRPDRRPTRSGVPPRATFQTPRQKPRRFHNRLASWLRSWHPCVKPSRHDAATSRQAVALFLSSTPSRRNSISR